MFITDLKHRKKFDEEGKHGHSDLGLISLVVIAIFICVVLHFIRLKLLSREEFYYNLVLENRKLDGNKIHHCKVDILTSETDAIKFNSVALFQTFCSQTKRFFKHVFA